MQPIIRSLTHHSPFHPDINAADQARRSNVQLPTRSHTTTSSHMTTTGRGHCPNQSTTHPLPVPLPITLPSILETMQLVQRPAAAVPNTLLGLSESHTCWHTTTSSVLLSPTQFNRSSSAQSSSLTSHPPLHPGVNAAGAAAVRNASLGLSES